MSFESCWASSGLSWLRSSRLHSFVWLWGIAVVAPSRHLHALLSTWDVYFDAQYWAWDLCRLLSRHKPASAVILPLLNHYWMLVSGCLGSKHPNVLYIEQGKPRSSVAPKWIRRWQQIWTLQLNICMLFDFLSWRLGPKWFLWLARAQSTWSECF